MFPRVDILVYTHPLVQVGDEYPVEGCRQKLVFGFKEGKPYQASGGMTVPAGGKSRSARISSCPYLKESNTLPRSSPTLNASGHCFSCSMIRSGRLTLPCTDSRNARSTRVTSSSVSLCSSL